MTHVTGLEEGSVTIHCGFEAVLQRGRRVPQDCRNTSSSYGIRGHERIILSQQLCPLAGNSCINSHYQSTIDYKTVEETVKMPDTQTEMYSSTSELRTLGPICKVDEPSLRLRKLISAKDW